jgi:hypothetical protein
MRGERRMAMRDGGNYNTYQCLLEVLLLDQHLVQLLPAGLGLAVAAVLSTPFIETRNI